MGENIEKRYPKRQTTVSSNFGGHPATFEELLEHKESGRGCGDRRCTSNRDGVKKGRGAFSTCNQELNTYISSTDRTRQPLTAAGWARVWCNGTVRRERLVHQGIIGVQLALGQASYSTATSFACKEALLRFVRPGAWRNKVNLIQQAFSTKLPPQTVERLSETCGSSANDENFEGQARWEDRDYHVLRSADGAVQRGESTMGWTAQPGFLSGKFTHTTRIRAHVSRMLLSLHKSGTIMCTRCRRLLRNKK